MPFQSKRQQRKFFAMEAQGELPKGTARRWAHHTPNLKSLPERKEAMAQPIADLAEKKAAFKVAFLAKLAASGVTPTQWFESLTKAANGSPDILSSLLGGGIDLGKSAISGMAGAIPTAAKAIGAGAIAAPILAGGAAGAAQGYMNAPTDEDIEILRKAELLGALRRHTQEVNARLAQRQTGGR